MNSRDERLAAFKSADLYLVISSEFCLGRPVTKVFEAAAANGVKVIQLREKFRGSRLLFELACDCRKIADRYGVLLMIDDCVDVALAAGADGVHLGQGDLPVEVARRLAPELLIGNSTHNPEEALAAQKSGADVINIGPIYPTRTKNVNHGAVGLEMISSVRDAGVKLPFSVMGGIKRDRFAELLAAGAEVLAMVTEITTAPDIGAKVRELREEYARHRKNGGTQ